MLLNQKLARPRLAASEAQIQKSILEYLQIKGIFCWRVNTGAVVSEYKGKKRFVRFGAPGVSDIVGIRSFRARVGGDLRPLIDFDGTPMTCIGRFFAIEVKKPGNKLSPAQEAFKVEVERAGGLFITAYSLADVEKALGFEG